jgi:hypothetical protein
MRLTASQTGGVFNEREGEDRDRFAETLGSVAGRRLTYEELTGKTATE